MKLLLRLFPCLLLLLAVGCRTCPIESCHTRKVHLHSGVKYHGQPFWKMQNPAIGQKIKTYNPKAGKNPQDKSRTLK
ncbi:hypothetical protein JAO73_19400 [Hymenobacter sp. BT523]|uniref:hypothetical protein n=1 Tax=Hymenobacter sp. BT523 TaxID=2795725 RepID=UPI0018EB4599|nr:hypothetical protein [Hymenobacter sp. BT523]MBJ6111197.1 hypothetical protein [Hymenobacter sp. BT523]